MAQWNRSTVDLLSGGLGTAISMVELSATLDDGLEALRRIDFYTQMADAERALQEDPDGWAAHVAERGEWLNPDLTGR